MQVSIRVQDADFDINTEYQRLRQTSPEVGAIVTFTGLVRELENETPIDSLTLQHYPKMTERVLSDIVYEANSRWPFYAATLIHRVGELKPTDQIVFVGIACAHRKNAFMAAEFIMDFLKKDAPFWKKVTANGNSEWVSQKGTDIQESSRW